MLRRGLAMAAVGLALPAPEPLERIGRLGEFWATRYEGGWTVYGPQTGAIVSGQTREQAERWIRCYEKARTWQGEHGPSSLDPPRRTREAPAS